MKNTMKKISLLFSIVIMSVLFVVSANALDTTGQCGDNIYWDFDSATGTLTLNGNGEMYDYSYAYNTPWYENGYAPYIKKAIVEEGITSLSGGSFWECYRMESVLLPSSLKEIGLAAFANCCSLKEINFPNNLEKLGESCFGACYGLTEITIPEKVKEIPDDCFAGCIKLRTINFSDSLERIGNRAFEGCYVLEKITLGENVDFLGYRAFRLCPTLKDLYILNPSLDLTANDAYVGKWIWLVDGYDRVKFFERYAELYSELVIYIADHNTGVRDVEALAGEEKAHYESIRDEYSEMTGKIENLQKYLGSSDNDYVISTLLTVHGSANSTAEAYAKENGIKFAEIKEEVIEDIVVTDKNTGIQAEYDSSVFDSEAELVIGEDGTNADIVFSDKYENYKSYDISFLIDGNKVQPNGKVTVKLPVPATFNAETIAVYYVEDNGNNTKLDSKVEDGFVVFETEHFSEYVIVDESSKIQEPAVPEEPEEPEQPSKECSCKCHKGGISGFFWKIANFFNKLFKIKSKQMCTCGIAHY